MEELRKSGKIYWIKSTPCLKKWILRDLRNRNILRSIYVKGETSSKGRWYFNPKYVDEFVEAFEKKELEKGPRMEA